MLLFSTVLDVDGSLTKDAFVRLVIEWNQTSSYASNVIPGLDWTGGYDIRFGTNQLWLAFQDCPVRDILAARFEKQTADGVIWDTDYVLDRKSRKLAIRLDRSFTPEALSFDPKFSTPHFITLLIAHGYLRDDGGLPVLRTPLPVDAALFSMIAKAAAGQGQQRLPIVFVSLTAAGTEPVDVGLLAARLKGVAHVSAAARPLPEGPSEKDGTIGIYYPARAKAHRSYPYRVADGHDAFLLEMIIRSVIQYCNAQTIDPLLTWQGVSNDLLKQDLDRQQRQRLDAEKARQDAEAKATQLLGSLDQHERQFRQQALQEARQESERILGSFDDDMKRLRQLVDKLAHDNELLQYENQGIKAKLDAADALPALLMGRERDLCPGEVKDMLLSVLDDALRTSIRPRSRRADIVRDIIMSNDYQGLAAAKAEQVKTLLKNYSGMDPRLRQQLGQLGFEITEQGKHYKLRYHGDERYQLTFAKTPSDVRGGLNSALEAIKVAF